MATPPDFTDMPGPWQQRFAFYYAHGPVSSTPQAKEAYRALPFGARFRLVSNVLAFLFGPFYFFVKGMWRKGLVLLGLAVVIAVAIVGLQLPALVERAGSVVVPAMAMTTANYAYYLQVMQRSRSWNPFEGTGRRTA
jgi:hypothetical protein